MDTSQTSRLPKRFSASALPRWLLVVLISALALLAITVWTFASPFSMIDDHGVVTFLMHPVSLAQDIQTDFVGARFRPLYWLIRHAEYHLFGANPFMWHLFTYGIGVATLVLGYGLLRRFLPRRYALFGLLLPLFYLGTSTIWYRLGPQEGVGVLLVIGALVALLWKHDNGFALLALLAATQKESFTLLLPAFIALYIFFRGRVISPQTMALALFGIFFGAIIAFLKIGVSDQYGAVITGTPGAGTMLNLVRYTFPAAGLTALLLAYPLANKRERRWTPLLLALWLVPQAALYTTLLFERYYFPGILIVSALTPLALYRLRLNRMLRSIAIVLLIVVMPVNLLALINQVQGATEYTAINRAFQANLQTIAQENPRVAHIDYGLDYQIEERASSRAFLEWYGYRGAIDFGCTTDPYC